MTKITVRVRSSARTSRFAMDDGDTLLELKQKIFEDTQIAPSSQKLSRDPKGVDEVSGDRSTLSSLRFRNGEMLHLVGADVAARPTSASGGRGNGVVMRRGEIVTAEDDSSSTRELTRWCQHRPGGACQHCCPAEEGAVKQCDHGPNAKCPNCVGEDVTGEEMEWLCSHPDDQMCSNCMGAEKGEKVELEMLCLHGPGGRCTNCLEDDSIHEQSAAHTSYQQVLALRRNNCDHAPSAICMYCIPPSQVSYSMRPNCPKHKPWPAGLCNDCQPPTCTLARQKYRHVDYVEVLAYDEFASFASLWQQTGMTIQRAGLLYGTVEPDPNYRLGTKVVVQAIYEPPQEGTAQGVNLLPDPAEAQVSSVAAALGLSRVGWIFTRPPRGSTGSGTGEGEDFVLSSHEIRQMARFQNSHLGLSNGGGAAAGAAARCEGATESRFVTLVLGQNEQGEIEPMAYMASDQCMALERANVFGDSDSPGFMKVREAGSHEVLPQILKGVGTGHNTMATNRFEPDFFVVKVNCGQPVTVAGQPPPRPLCRHSTFPVENRAMFGIKRSPGSVTSQLVTHSSEPFHHRISDFHCLVYLPQLFDVATAEMFCESVRNDTPLIEGLTVMLEAMQQS